MTEPLDVLVVGWYPSADDPIAGRFVADQAAALAATGRVRPWAASFEPFWLHGDLSLRTRAADAWPAAVRTAAAEGRAIFPEGAFGPSGVPVVHLGAAAGRSAGAGRDNEAVHRERALQALVDGAGRHVDLIHAHVGYPEGAAAARVAARIGVPLVLTEHATYLARIFADPAHRARYADAVRSAARVVAVGSALAAQIRAGMPHAAAKLVVIPNTVDVAAFPLQGPDDRDPDELLWVGYRREVKGTGTLLRAFARVRAARPGTVLRLVGRSTTEDEEAGWRQLAAELGIADAVRFDPPADRVGVAAAMARAGLFVHPGTRETFGIVAVEALASGMPVVATDSGGVTEVLGPDPGALGALVPHSDPAALADAILATLARRRSFDPARLRAHAESRYGAPAVAGRIADLYDEVLHEAAGAGSCGRAVAQGTPDAAASPRAAPAQVAPDHEPSPLVRAPRVPSSAVLVAFDRPALDRVLPACPAWLLRDLVVVTRGGAVAGVRETVAVDSRLEPEVAALLAWSGRGGGGLRSLVRSPLAWLRRRRRRRRLELAVLPALESAVAAGIARVNAAGGQPDEPALLACLGGIDIVATLPAVGAGRAMLAPGALRWLGDARWPLTDASAVATGDTHDTSEPAAGVELQRPAESSA
jgi:glycosyltransferase involved in cell wall biosynthesis